MRRGKKIWSILLTMVMVFAMMVPVMADDDTIPATADITISGTGGTFSAWRLLNATDGGNGKLAYTFNSKYEDAFEAVISKTDQDSILAYLEDLRGEAKAAQLRTFADNMYKYLHDNKVDPDKVSKGNEFNDVAQGYYLIAETEKGADPDTVSKVMLDTKGKNKLTVETKEGTVDFEKKVKETNDTTGAISGWQDGADYDIGDAVPFQMKATLPNDFEDYTTYQLTFHDKQSSGLTFNTGTTEDPDDAVTVSVDGKPITKNYYDVLIAPSGQCGCTFEIKFDNLKAVTDAKNGSVITVEYTSTLNDDAVIGSVGNPNEAYLEFTNDMYGDGDGTGKTVKDKVIVFTYDFVVNKVDGDENPLTGADFTLYKQVGTSLVEVARKSVNDDGTTFTFTGLDAGTYKLVETTVPAGYNKADDIEFTITAEYEVSDPDPKFISLTTDVTSITDKNENGILVTDVENNAGVELPSTGGIGTTIFYAAGGILVVGAAVLLFAKKRTENEE